MRSRWPTTAFLLVVLLVVWVVGCGAAERPVERVSPAPQVNPKAVIWRTPEPPKEARAGDVWVNPKDGAEMVYVAAGKFILGTSDAQIGALLKTEATLRRTDLPGEQPQCRVDLPGYWIGRTEVTNAQYLRFIRATGQRAPEHWKSGRIPSGLENFPVVNVNWEEARAYCEWAGVRLPSELEWEKAARGTDGRVFPWGDKWDSKRCRNFELVMGSKRAASLKTGLERGMFFVDWAQAHDGVREGPVPVGSYRAGVSPYGCLDMAGNVSEWCSDWYDEGAYARYAKGDLTPPAIGQERVLRGGAWAAFFPRAVRVASRRSYAPDPRDYSRLTNGFRCARGLASGSPVK